MTCAEVANRVAEIEQSKGDDEIVHRLEDQLYRDVLQWIADNCGPSQEGMVARIALKTQDVDFARWCA